MPLAPLAQHAEHREQIAVAVADLVELPTVPLRVPVGAVAEQVIAARDATPYDRAFARL